MNIICLHSCVRDSDDNGIASRGSKRGIKVLLLPFYLN